MVHIQVNFGKSTYIVFKVDAFDNVEQACAAFIEAESDFWNEVFGGTDRIEDASDLTQLELGGIYSG